MAIPTANSDTVDAAEGYAAVNLSNQTEGSGMVLQFIDLPLDKSD